MRFDQKSSAVAALFSPDSKYIVSCGFKTIYVVVCPEMMSVGISLYYQTLNQQQNHHVS
jgi:hypothetical protein